MKVTKEIIAVIRNKIIKDEMTLEDSIEYIFSLKGGKDEDENKN